MFFKLSSTSSRLYNGNMTRRSDTVNKMKSSGNAKKKDSKLADKRTLMFMALPPLIILLIFSYGPIFGWTYAFFDYRIGLKLSQAEFVGFKFFKLAFMDPDLVRVLTNTVVMSLLALLVLPLSAAFAILLSELRSGLFKRVVQTTTTLPYFISWVIVYSIFFTFLAPGDGFINNVLMKANILTKPLDPLGNSDTVWAFQTMIRIWKDLGYTAIIFFAAIAGIDSELYDAAKVDGAARFHIIVHIIIPGLIPTFITLLIINVGFLLSGFDQYYVFYNPMVGDKLEVIDYYAYRIGLQTNDIPFATALSMSKTFVSAGLVFFANWVSKKVRGQSIL